jgi:hypothetical protein
MILFWYLMEVVVATIACQIPSLVEIFPGPNDYAAVSVQRDDALETFIPAMGYTALEPQCVGLYVTYHEIDIEMAVTTCGKSALGVFAVHTEGVYPVG